MPRKKQVATVVPETPEDHDPDAKEIRKLAKLIVHKTRKGKPRQKKESPAISQLPSVGIPVIAQAPKQRKPRKPTNSPKALEWRKTFAEVMKSNVGKPTDEKRKALREASLKFKSKK